MKTEWQKNITGKLDFQEVIVCALILNVSIPSAEYATIMIMNVSMTIATAGKIVRSALVVRYASQNRNAHELFPKKRASHFRPCEAGRKWEAFLEKNRYPRLVIRGLKIHIKSVTNPVISKATALF